MHASLELDAAPASAGRARRWLRDRLTDWGLVDVEELATLLTSELVTNSFLHANTPITVRVERRPDVLRVEVEDLSPLTPVERRFSVDSGTGRGLRLVAELARRWGSDLLSPPSSGGKRVWFELGLGDGDDDRVGAASDRLDRACTG